jgi:TP901 family phage tail tape measure protein
MAFQQVGVRAVVNNLAGFIGDINRIDGAINRIGNASQSSSAGATILQGALLAIGGAGVFAALNAIDAGIRAIGEASEFAFKNTVVAAADLEAQMSTIAAVLNVGTAEAEQLRQVALQLGINPLLKVTTIEAAQAMEMLAKNGLTMTDIMNGAAEASIFLSNATGAGFSEAADVATDAMFAFGIEAEGMIDAVNGIVSVVNNSKFDVNDYMYAISQGGGFASQAGVEFDDFNAAIAAIAPAASSGRVAGTSLRYLLARLSPDTDKARTAMESLGLITEETGNVFYDAQGNLKPMIDIVAEMEKAFSGLTEEQRTNLTQTIFGMEGQRAANALISVGAEEFAALQERMGETDAYENARTRIDNLRGSLEIMRGIFEAVGLQIGAEFLPVLKSGIDTVLIPFANALNEKIAPYLDKFGTQLRRVGVLAGRFGTVIGRLFGFEIGEDGIGAFVDAGLEKLSDFIDKAIEFGFEVQRGFGEATTAFLDFKEQAGPSLDRISDAFDRIKLAVQGVFDRFSEAFQNNPHLSEFFDELSTVSEDGGVDGAVSLIDGIADAMENLAGAVETIAPYIGDISELFGIIAGATAGNYAAAPGQVTDSMDAISGLMEKIAEVFSVTDLDEIDYEKVFDIIDDISARISELASESFANLKEDATEATSIIMDSLIPFSEALLEFAKAYLQLAGLEDTDAGEVIIDFLEDINTFLENAEGLDFNFLVDGATALAGGLDTLTTALQGLTDQMLLWDEDMPNLADFLTGDQLNENAEWVKGIIADVEGIGQEIFAAFIKGLTTVQGGQSGASTGAFSVAPTIIAAFEKVGEEVMAAFTKGMGVAGKAITALSAMISGMALSAYTYVVTEGPKLFESIANAIVTGIDDAIAAAFGQGNVQPVKDGVKRRLTDNIVQPIDDTIATVEERIAFLGSIMNTIGELSNIAFETAKGYIIMRVQETYAEVTTKWEEIKTAVSEKVEAIKTEVTTKWEEVKTAVSEKVEEIKTTVTAKWEEIRAAISEKVEAVKTTVSDGFLFVKTEVETKINEAKTAVENALLTLDLKFQQTFGMTVPEAVKTGMETVSTTIQTKLQEAQTFAEGVAKDFIKIGTGIVNSIADGITAAAQAITDAVDAALQGALETARSIASQIRDIVLNALTDTTRAPSGSTTPRSGGGTTNNNNVNININSNVNNGMDGVAFNNTVQTTVASAIRD